MAVANPEVGSDYVTPTNQKWALWCHHGSDGRHLFSVLNERRGDYLHRSRRITSVAGKSHLPTWEGSHDSRHTVSVSGSPDSLNESDGDHLLKSKWVTCVAVKGHLPTWGLSGDTH